MVVKGGYSRRTLILEYHSDAVIVRAAFPWREWCRRCLALPCGSPLRPSPGARSELIGPADANSWARVDIAGVLWYCRCQTPPKACRSLCPPCGARAELLNARVDALGRARRAVKGGGLPAAGPRGMVDKAALRLRPPPVIDGTGAQARRTCSGGYAMRRQHSHAAHNSWSDIKNAYGSACGSPPKMNSQAIGYGTAKRVPIARSRRELKVEYQNFFRRGFTRAQRRTL